MLNFTEHTCQTP